MQCPNCKLEVGDNFFGDICNDCHVNLYGECSECKEFLPYNKLDFEDEDHEWLICKECQTKKEIS